MAHHISMKSDWKNDLETVNPKLIQFYYCNKSDFKVVIIYTTAVQALQGNKMWKTKIAKHTTNKRNEKGK